MIPFVLAIIVLLTGCSYNHLLSEKKPPEDMVFVPAGWFEMGSIESDGRIGMTIGVDEIPKHNVYVKDFYIDRFEITNTQFLNFLIKSGDSYRPSHWEERASFLKGEDNHPVVDIDWLDAEAYCKWTGKRLPKEVEWEKAARGPDGKMWPWGNTYNKDMANTSESGRMWTSPIGSYPGDVSPYGVYDMAGNVREWVDGWYEAYPGNTQPDSYYFGPYRVLRGGSYETTLHRYGRAASRYAVTSTIATRGHTWHSNFDHGFRCAKAP